MARNKRAFSGFLRRLRASRKGNVLALTALSLPIMVGGAGFGVDITQWYLWKRELQLAADTAALSGAYALAQSKSYSSSATSSLAANLNAVSTYTPAVALGNWSSGTNNAVTVGVTTNRALPFSAMLGISPPTIRAQATAAVIDAGTHCMVSLNESAASAVSIGGNALLRLGCGISSNSNNPDSFRIFGSAQVEASPLSSAGGISYNEDNLIGDTTVRPYSVKQADPLAALTTPASGAAQTYNKNNSTLQPGTYSDLQLRASHTMAPGVYTIDGGTLKINANYNLTGSGVVIVLKNGATIDIQGGANISLTAPTSTEAASMGLSSDFGGVLIYEDKATASEGQTSKINGNATLHLGGAIYLPKQALQMNGNASPSTQCLLLVADMIDISGNPIIPNSCPAGSSPPGYFGAKVVRLVA